MKQFTLSFFRRLVLAVLAVVGFTTTSYAQDNWTEVYSDALVDYTYNNFKTDITNSMQFSSDFSVKSDISSGTCPVIYPFKTNCYVAVRYSVESAGTYKFSYRFKGTSIIDMIYFSEPESKITVKENVELTGSVEDIETESFEIQTPGDYYFGFYLADVNDAWNLYFCDFRVFKNETAQAVTTYSVTVNPTNCTVSVTDAEGTAISDLNAVPEKTNLKVTVTPDANYEFASLTYKLGADGVETSLVNGGTFELTDNAVITAVCNEAQQTEVTWDAPQGTAHDSENRYVTSATTEGASSELNYTQDSKPSSHYIDTKSAFTVERDQTFKLHMVSTSDMKWCHAIVFFDWNRDGEFEAQSQKIGYDSGEYANLPAEGNPGVCDFTIDVTVPADAVIGETRMRVQYTDAWHNKDVAGHPHSAMDAIDKGGCYDFVMNITESTGPEKVTVTLNPVENGTLTVKAGDTDLAEGANRVVKGTELTITAEPSEGYVLGSVTVNSVELEGNTYTANEDVTIAATFNVTKVSASVESANTEQGSVAFEGRDESSVTVDYGTKLTLTATPATGYMFDKWTDKTTGNVLSYRYTLEISVVSDTAYVANFVAEDYPLMTRYYEVGLSQQNRYLANASYRTAEDAKSVDLFNCETEEELPFVEYKELHVAQREGAVVDKTSTPVNITEGATEFYMSFQQYNKNIVVGDETCEPELGWTKQTAYIDWNNDKKFEGDEIYDALGNQNGGDENTFGDTNGNVVDGWSRRFPVPADVKAGTYRMRVVFFAPKDPVTEKTLFTEGFGEIRNGVAYDFNVVVGEAPEEYTVAWETPQNGKLVVLNANDTINSGDKVLENTVLTVKAIPADSTYQVVEVKDGETVLEADSEGIYSVTVAADVNLTATFEKIQYSVTWEAPENGMLVVKNGNDTIKSGSLIDAGTVLTVVATPDEHYELTSLTYKTGDEEAVELDGTQFKLNGNTVLAATFGLVQYEFTYDIVGGSWVADVTITYSNGEAIEDGAKLGYGTEFIVKAVKKISQYTYVNILVNNEQVTADVSGNTYTYTGKVEGDTYVKVDLFSDINDVDSEAVYYDGATETIYTAGADVKVYDMSGRLVLNAEDVESVSVAELNDGLYTAVVGETVLKFRK